MIIVPEGGDIDIIAHECVHHWLYMHTGDLDPKHESGALPHVRRGLYAGRGERLIGSIIASVLGWLVGKLISKKKESEIEERYAEARKENVELRAENAGLRVVREIEGEETEVRKEWEEAEENNDTRKKYEILKRDFGGDD